MSFDDDEMRRKKPRLSSNARDFVDLTGSEEPEDRGLGPGSSARPVDLTSDAAYARQLQVELDGEYSARRSSQNDHTFKDLKLSGSHSPIDRIVGDDAALARQLHAEFEREAQREYSDLDAISRSDDSHAHDRALAPLQAKEVESKVRELIQPIHKSKCQKCKKMLFKDEDIYGYAQILLDAAKPDAIELNCHSCHCTSAYLQTRSVRIWLVLCYFDYKSKHNKPHKKTIKPKVAPSPPLRYDGNPRFQAANNGTGYGGSRHSSKPPKTPKSGGGNVLTPFSASDDVDDFFGDGSDYDSEEYDEQKFEQIYGKAHTLGPVPQSLPSSSSKPERMPKQPPRVQCLNEDDEMTLKVMNCLANLLPSFRREEDVDPDDYTSPHLLLCSSVLDRTAEFLRNNDLDAVTSQISLYVSLINFVETIASHPLTSALVFGERLIRSPGVSILQISQGKGDLVLHNITDTARPLGQCMHELASQADVMLRCQDTDVDDSALFQAIKDLENFINANAGSTKGKSSAKKDDWHKDLAVSEVPDQAILERHSLVSKAATGARQLGRMGRIMQEIARLKASLPNGIFVRYCDTRPDVMKILIIGPQGSPYENGLFEFDLLCGADFPQKPPQMDFRTTGGGVVHFNPNLYPCGKICLSLLGTWAGEPWVPKQSTLLQIVVSIQAMVFCENPYQNEPGRENISGSDAMCKAYNRSLYPHTIQTAMLDWLEQKSFSKPAAGARPPYARGGPQKVEAKHDTSNIWAEIVTRHFEDNAEDIISTVDRWLDEPIPDTKTQSRHPSMGGFPGAFGHPSLIPPSFPLEPLLPKPAKMTGKGHVLGGSAPSTGQPSTHNPWAHGLLTSDPKTSSSTAYGPTPTDYGSTFGKGHTLGGALPIQSSFNPFASTNSAVPSVNQGQTLGQTAAGGLNPTGNGGFDPFSHIGGGAHHAAALVNNDHTHGGQIPRSDSLTDIVHGGPAGTGWQGKTLGGETPDLADGSVLVQKLRGALVKLKSRGGNGRHLDW